MPRDSQSKDTKKHIKIKYFINMVNVDRCNWIAAVLQQLSFFFFFYCWTAQNSLDSTRLLCSWGFTFKCLWILALLKMHGRKKKKIAKDTFQYQRHHSVMVTSFSLQQSPMCWVYFRQRNWVRTMAKFSAELSESVLAVKVMAIAI